MFPTNRSHFSSSFQFQYQFYTERSYPPLQLPRCGVPQGAGTSMVMPSSAPVQMPPGALVVGAAAVGCVLARGQPDTSAGEAHLLQEKHLLKDKTKTYLKLVLSLSPPQTTSCPFRAKPKTLTVRSDRRLGQRSRSSGASSAPRSACRARGTRAAGSRRWAVASRSLRRTQADLSTTGLTFTTYRTVE